MSPIIALKIGLPNLVMGSTRGSRIIGYVAHDTAAHKGWGMNVQAAVSIPHAINRFGTFELEKGTLLENMVEPLEALGYRFNAHDHNSGLNAISIANEVLSVGGDPRSEGIALGQ